MKEEAVTRQIHDLVTEIVFLGPLVSLPCQRLSVSMQWGRCTEAEPGPSSTSTLPPATFF